jgi:hypothetical protein
VIINIGVGLVNSEIIVVGIVCSYVQTMIFFSMKLWATNKNASLSDKEL